MAPAVQHAALLHGLWARMHGALARAQVSDSFRRLHEVFYGNYRVEACALWRQEKLPIAWHGHPAWRPAPLV